MQHGTGSILKALFCWVCLAVGASAQAGTPQFRFDVPPGPFAVGLTVLQKYDYSRVWRGTVDERGLAYHGERARPLQILVWYPAQRGDARPLTLEDYWGLWATETHFTEPLTPYKAKEWHTALGSSLAQSLRAVRDAPEANGHFHVVIYAPGASDTAWDNADLCEYLASFGYIVIASPSIGPTGRTMTIDMDGVEAQSRDIRYLIDYAMSRPDTESQGVALLGSSWGGLASLLAAARDSRITALMSLDGSMRYYPGLLQLATDVHPEQMSIPFLDFLQGDYSLENVERFSDPHWREGPSVLLSWNRGDLIVAHMLGMSHASLSSLWQRNEDYWSEWGKTAIQPGDYDRDDAIKGYAWVARYAVKFLDAYLKHDGSAEHFLRAPPGNNGVPRHVMSVTYHPGSASGSSLDEFRTATGRQGFEHVAEIYAQFQQRTPGFKLDETVMSDWTAELLDAERWPEAIALLKFGVQIHPGSGTAYAALADAYDTAGQVQSAIASYQQALALDPTNQTARRKLDDLRANQVGQSRSNSRRPDVQSLAAK